MRRRTWIVIAVAAAVGLLAYFGWRFLQEEELPQGIAMGNGRIEAVEIDLATKTAGRVESLEVREGEFVEAGEPLARMRIVALEAQLREAQAQRRQAESSVISAQSTVTQRRSAKAAAEAVVAQRLAERDVAQRNLDRAEQLFAENAMSPQELDDFRALFHGAEAAVRAAEAEVAAADAAIATAQAQVIEAEAAVEAAQATIERLEADIAEATLTAPRNGRVQYLVAYPGEVLSAGGIVLNMIDLSDVYMTFFLPTEQAGRLAIGSEARIVLDAAPQFVIPARVTFVSDVAQFTPRTVETQEERLKLMFRIRAHIDPELLRENIRDVKTGLPGVTYVRLNPNVPWPDHLQVRLPR